MDPIAHSEPLTERVANAIREAIAKGAFSPGEHLSVPELARRLGVSRTPTREALLILEREGLVANRPRLGAEVLRVSGSGYEELIDMREALDGMAARLAAKRITAEQRSALQELLKAHESALRDSDMERHIELDLEFHGLLRDAACNQRLAKALLDIERQIHLHIRASTQEPWFSAKVVVRDHGAIAAAVCAGDADAAETAARAHVQRMREFSVALNTIAAANAAA